jgi:hypothetical protein
MARGPLLVPVLAERVPIYFQAVLGTRPRSDLYAECVGSGRP